MTGKSAVLFAFALLAMGSVVISCSSGSGGGSSSANGSDCGNGVIDRGEQCDGTVAVSCSAFTNGERPIGTVACSACQYDLSDCHTASGAGSGGVSSSSGGVSSSGGAASTGGTSNGGTSNGGTSNGGTSNGGTSNGGTSNGGTSNGGTSSGGSTGANPIPDIDAIRQACVDTINGYRATVGGLAPLTLAGASVEQCSDAGAKSDAIANKAHGSFGKCQGMSAQDTCPGWDPKNYGGIEGALKACLQAMWGEGPPTGETRDKCVQDFLNNTDTSCYLKHGHYLNMSDPGSSIVACGFYLMPNGDVWMNQDLGN